MGQIIWCCVVEKWEAILGNKVAIGGGHQMENVFLVVVFVAVCKDFVCLGSCYFTILKGGCVFAILHV